MQPEIQRQQVERHEPAQTGVLRVTGRVRRPFVLSMKELCSMDAEEAKEISIICGSGTPEGRIESCRGAFLEKMIERLM